MYPNVDPEKFGRDLAAIVNFAIAPLKKRLDDLEQSKATDSERIRSLEKALIEAWVKTIREFE